MLSPGAGEQPGPARRCAVLGSPVAHSLSPVLHRAGYAALGLDWRYDAYDVDEAGLAGFLSGLGAEWRGLSLTMPLKRAVLALVDEVSERARSARAANTVLLGERLVAENTDIPGAVAALREVLAAAPRSAVVLGGGATAASAALAVAELGCTRIRVAVRDADRAAETLAVAREHPTRPRVEPVALGDRHALDGLDGADVLVSTIPAHAQTEAMVAAAADVACVFDVVYDPWPTPLAVAARARGQRLVSGLDLLVHQAAEQFRLMTGVAAPLERMRSAGLAALGDR